jgi:hypothetical protein
MKLENSHLVTVFFTEIIALCLITSFRLINSESTATLLIFNVLFISLVFPLEASFNRKLSLLALGNIIGLFWNFVFHSFAIAGDSFYGGAFRVIWALSYPLLNFIWILTFWSLSLTALPKRKSMF